MNHKNSYFKCTRTFTCVHVIDHSNNQTSNNRRSTVFRERPVMQK